MKHTRDMPQAMRVSGLCVGDRDRKSGTALNEKHPQGGSLNVQELPGARPQGCVL